MFNICSSLRDVSKLCPIKWLSFKLNLQLSNLYLDPFISYFLFKGVQTMSWTL